MYDIQDEKTVRGMTRRLISATEHGNLVAFIIVLVESVQSTLVESFQALQYMGMSMSPYLEIHHGDRTLFHKGSNKITMFSTSHAFAVPVRAMEDGNWGLIYNFVPKTQPTHIILLL